MVKKLSASALACALVFFCAPFAPSQENKSENSGFLINYEEIMEDDISMINLPARHERRLAQNETIRNHDGCLAFYSDFKDFVQEKTGLRYGVDISYTAQRVAPGGKNTAVQVNSQLSLWFLHICGSVKLGLCKNCSIYYREKSVKVDLCISISCCSRVNCT